MTRPPPIRASATSGIVPMRLVAHLAPFAASVALAGAVAPAAHADLNGEFGRPHVPVPGSVAVVPRTASRFVTVAQADFDAQFEKDRGSIARARTWNALDVEHRLDARWAVRLEAEFEVDLYDIRGSQRVLSGPGRLLETGVRTHLAPGVDWRVSRDWKIGADVAFETTSVPGATLADSYTIGESAYVWHRFSPSIALRVGLKVLANLDDPPTIIPFVVPDDVDATSPGLWRFEGRGTGGRLGYAFTPKLTAGVAGAYDRRDWRLASDDRAPAGIARDIRITAGLFVDVAPRVGMTFGLDVGMTVLHEFEVADRRGDSITRLDASPSAYVALSLSWRF